MNPVLFSISGLEVYSYGFFIALGITLSFFFFKRESKLDYGQVSDMFLYIIVAPFVGAKVLFYLEDLPKYISHPSLIFSSPGQGFVFYGSFLFVLATLWWWFRRQGLPFRGMMDLIGIGGALVLGFGKLGCFMAGCCHGSICDPAFGIVFSNPQSMAEPLGQTLYPVQLYDALLVFSIVGFLLWYKKRRPFAGQLFLIFGMAYSFGRCITELYRGDESRGFLFGGLLSHSQFIGLLVISVSLYFWRKWRRV